MDMQTGSFAGALLRFRDEVLLMHRSDKKILSPGLWAGIAGHMEQSEMNSPVTACLREIEEETGILPAQIEKLDLRYFALCKTETALDSIYYFSGLLKEKPTLSETPEGTLHWIKLEDGINLQMADHNLYEIGYETRPDYRQKGIATAATIELTNLLLDTNIIPFMGFAWSNIASKNVAIKSGYIMVRSSMETCGKEWAGKVYCGEAE